MMTKNQANEREQIGMKMLTVDQFIPQNHIVRKLDAAIDFPLIHSLFVFM